jgi:hypothetical protein
MRNTIPEKTVKETIFAQYVSILAHHSTATAGSPQAYTSK